MTPLYLRSSETAALSRGQILPRLSVCLLAGAVALLVTGCKSKPAKTGAAQAAQHLDFNQDVQPILASNCFNCHGPDPEMRKAGLRLDLAESAFKKRPGHPDAIVAGHPELSELIKRIESKDPHYLMPQSTQGDAKPMKPEDIAILKEWIKEGAVYKPHWAFEKPVRPALPAVDDKGWKRNPIDVFVLTRMKKEGLTPSPEANKETLIRRVTLDLTGLLPTPSEVNTFVKDSSPQAYEHLVDYLLARQSFGEQRTRYWMDYARYADTYGLHLDNRRHAWPYRDYLIRSFNNNKPFDQFAMEQIAGDMLPSKNLDALLGSGYVRSGVSSNEGGTIPEELRVNLTRERTEAYGAAFMGLTVGCAVCHDHKYDPTTQKDFYSLSAFFNNMDELPYNGDTPHWAPVVRIPKPQKMEAYNKILAQRSSLVSQLNAMHLDHRKLIKQWVDSRRDPAVPVSGDQFLLRLKLDEGGGEVFKNSAPHAAQASFPIGKFKPQWGETTWFWPDFRMDTSARVMLGQMGDYDWNQSFSSGGWFMLRAAPNYSNTSGTLISKMDTGQHNRGWDLYLDQGVINVDLVSGGPKNLPAPETAKSKTKPELFKRAAFEYPTPDGLDILEPKQRPKRAPESKAEKAAAEAKRKADAVKAQKPKDPTPWVGIRVATLNALPLDNKWDHVFFTYDGSGKASGVKIYVNGNAVATKVVYDSLAHSTIKTQAPMQLGWRYPEADPAQDTRYQDIRLYARTLAPEEVGRLPFEDYVSEVLATPAANWTEDQWHVVSSYYFDSVDAKSKALQSQIVQLDGQLQQLSTGGDLSIVASEKPSLAYADVLARGVYSARLERVEANTPHFLPPLPAGIPHDRLALAKWTVSPDNPLTARVTVNRMWNEVFGTGLVETTEDFGIVGGRPSHPQLLDWMAVEFRESGWNIKHMYKLMVTSAAYRQNAKSTPEQIARDPRNLLLSHGPRFRMDSEMLRDIALQSGGLLVNKVGGPSVKPYQPQNVWEQVSYPNSDTLNYEQGHGDALYRRSMYTFWKRMATMPDMDAFDAPMRDVVCTQRQRTDTPLQALVMMNDVQWVEASRALAQRVIKEGGKQPKQRINLLGNILLSRDPPPQMSSVLEASLATMEKHYEAHPKAANQLIGVGEKRSDPSIPAPELAAWTMVASEMMNLDEAVTK